MGSIRLQVDQSVCAFVKFVISGFQFSLKCSYPSTVCRAGCCVLRHDARNAT